MLRVKGLITALMLLVPTIASAGLIYSSASPTPAATYGSISPLGVKVVMVGTQNYTVTPANGYAIGKVTLDGVPLAPNAGSLNNGAKTYTVPFKGTSQKINAFFVTAPASDTVTAVTPSKLMTKPSTNLTISGVGSTVSLSRTTESAAYTWAVSPAGPTLTPAGGTTETSAGLNAIFKTATAGAYTVTLTLGGTTSVTNVVVSSTNVNNSSVCLSCHGDKLVGYAGSVHATNATGATCQQCHNPNMALNHPGLPAPQCVSCHSAVGTNVSLAFVDNCGLCHGDSIHTFVAGQGKGSFEGGAACAPCHGDSSAPGINHITQSAKGCIGCHSVAAPDHQNQQPNQGVRAITAEFSKWSHHVTGVELNNVHCVACHLEGKIQNGYVVTDTSVHMTDTSTHLRNADDDSDMTWDPQAPNHSTMDTFCMSCHDSNGATSVGSKAVQSYINTNQLNATGKTASATNPFGDTISNRYDKMFRPAVVNVSSQFDTTNNSHHAVKGPRYTGRTRTAGARQIASPNTFAANSSSTLWGKRSTIYDSVNAVTGADELATNPAFNALYVPLENNGGETAPRTGAATLGDDSTLHCGDCHTVGQWKAGTAQSFNPVKPTTAVDGFTSPAIGAHGSNNEYMLRNSRGTDERHTQDAYEKNTALNTPNPGPAGTITLKNPNAAFLVCFNCHSYGRYGSVYNATGTTGPHAGEYDAGGRCNGVGHTIPFNGYTTGTATDGTQFASRFMGPRLKYSSTPAYAPGFPLDFTKAPGGVQAATYVGEQDPDFGNIFGISCNSCHNSGVGNGYGGIHGSANNSPGTANSGTPSVSAPAGGAYVNGMGNWAKVERFLPGLGNVMHVPGTLGGVTGGSTYGPITNSTYSIQVNGVVTTGANVYTFKTGGTMNDTNWEQVAWQQVANAERGVVDTARAGAGCYTLPLNSTSAPAYGLEGQSVDGGKTIPEVLDTWGGCDDHQGNTATTGGTKGAGDHGFIKRINRPITY